LIARRQPYLTQGLAFIRRPEVKRTIRIGVVALIVIFVARALATSWSGIAAHHWHINWLLLVLGFALLVGQEISYGFIWGEILQRLGYSLPFRIALRIYLVAEFVRYIPGNVWHVLARVSMAEKQGVPKSQGFASMTVELATKIATAALAFALSLFFWTDLHALSGAGKLATVSLGVIAVPLLVVGLQPRLLEWGLNRGMKLLKRPAISLRLTNRDIGTVTLSWLGSWLVGGLGFWLAVAAIYPLPASPAVALICVGIYALGWDIGFLSFITPSGLFFREGAVALLLHLSGLVPDLALGGLIALLTARLLPTLAELLSVGAAYGLTRGQMDANQAASAVARSRP
jgi:glycosyltransferase 2 family protein